MAKQVQKNVRKKIRKEEILSLEPINYKIIGAGLVTILLGYLALDTKPWDGVMALDVAPVLLVLGYCVIVPFGIIYRKKSSRTEDTSAALPQQ